MPGRSWRRSDSLIENMVGHQDMRSIGTGGFQILRDCP